MKKVEIYTQWERRCATKNCHIPSTHLIHFDSSYRGILHEKTKPVCEKHAYIFANKHGLQVPKLLDKASA